MRRLLNLMSLFAAASLSGCAGFSKDAGFGTVAQDAESAAKVHLEAASSWPHGPAEEAKSAARASSLLDAPLACEDAVEIALLNSHTLRAAFEQLNVSEADLVQAGRLPNPRFDWRQASGGGEVDVEETLSFNVLSLLALPYAHAIERGRFARTQRAVVQSVVQLAAATRAAYYEALAAQQSLAYRQQEADAAATAAELARRMLDSGNWNRLDAAHEQAFGADAVQNLAHARLANELARERLLRLLGLPAVTGSVPALRLAAAVPDLPATIEPLPDVERAVLSGRIDLQIMHMQITELAQRLHLTKATRVVNVLDVGAARIRQGDRGDAPTERGWVLSLEVPLFDGGGARVKKAQALYAQAVDRFAQAAVDARSQIRVAYAAYQTSFELAKRQRDEVLPLRKALAQENLQRFNASLISVFDLLTDAREQIESVDAYTRYLADFWIARSQLDASLVGDPQPGS